MAAKKQSRARSAGSTQDDFYTRLRERVTGWAQGSKVNPKYRDYVLALPDLFHLVVKLTMDKRVDATSKAALGAAIAWAIVPFDIIPDVLGPLGMLDDLLVLVLALDFMLDRTPRAVVLEHWAGSGDVFALIRNVLDRADEWMGRGLYKKIRAMMERGMGGAQSAPGGASTGRRKSTARRKTTTRRAAQAESAPRATARKKTATRKTAKKSARKATARKTTKAGA
jgi:uncharacterized membrane protein YkvA (DUF1232 family)